MGKRRIAERRDEQQTIALSANALPLDLTAFGIQDILDLAVARSRIDEDGWVLYSGNDRAGIQWTYRRRLENAGALGTRPAFDAHAGAGSLGPVCAHAQYESGRAERQEEACIYPNPFHMTYLPAPCGQIRAITSSKPILTCPRQLRHKLRKSNT
jgi:hypothetical protein